MYLGLDLGTSGLKVMLVDREGQAIATANANYPVAQPHPSWSEQNPGDWCNALENAIAELKQNHAKAVENIKALGISGQNAWRNFIGCGWRGFAPMHFVE